MKKKARIQKEKKYHEEVKSKKTSRMKQENFKGRRERKRKAGPELEGKGK